MIRVRVGNRDRDRFRVRAMIKVLKRFIHHSLVSFRSVPKCTRQLYRMLMCTVVGLVVAV